MKMQQKNDELKAIIRDVLNFGDLLLISNKGMGKTNSLMVLASEFRKMPNCRTIIFEDFPKFCNEFENVPFMVIKDHDVVETKESIDLTDSFVVHERDYTVKRGTELKEALNNKDLIFVMEIKDIERTAFFIYSVVEHFYRKHYLRAYKGYQKSERVIFIIEESQNVFDSSTISKKLFNRLRKIFSVARNLGLHFILASQRLQDLNTKIRGRTRLLLGQVSLDDYELKVRRLLRHSQYRTDILSFPVGKFLYTATDSTVRFPKFESHGKPYEICKEQIPQPKKESRLKRIAKSFLGLSLKDAIQKGKPNEFRCVECSKQISEQEYYQNSGYCNNCKSLELEEESEEFPISEL